MTKEEAKLHMIIRKQELERSVAAGLLAEDIEAFDVVIRSLEAWDAVKADIHGMEFIYDKSPLLNDKRTDAQKASDWWGMERLIILDIIDKHLREVENGRYSEF